MREVSRNSQLVENRTVALGQSELAIDDLEGIELGEFLDQIGFAGVRRGICRLTIVLRSDCPADRLRSGYDVNRILGVLIVSFGGPSVTRTRSDDPIEGVPGDNAYGLRRSNCLGREGRVLTC